MPKNSSNDEEGIMVAIRMRPLNARETTPDSESASQGTSRVWRVLPSYNSCTQTLPTGAPLKEKVQNRTFFTYDKAFGEASTTTDVYTNTAKGIVGSVTEGLNGTVFAYGQTSSGKTFTMQGSEPTVDAEHPGIIHMAASDIFQSIESTTTRDYLIRCSFIEIYNEEVRDLLASSSPLEIREHPKKGVYVDAKETIVGTFEQLLNVLTQGERHRAVAATGMNDRSSRSHTIFRITLESRLTDEEQERISQLIESEQENKTPAEGEVGQGEKKKDECVRVSTLNLVDLAGSESVRLTGASGERQKEGGKINQSLLTLSRVIHSLGQASNSGQHVHVNYRDSKLTRILQPSLSGNARMAVICCATPSELYLEETRSTLQFAARAKMVKTRAKVNEVLDDRAVIKKLQAELNEVKKLAGGNKAIKRFKMMEKERDEKSAHADKMEQKLAHLKNCIIKGGTLFNPLPTVHPSLRTPAKTRRNNRRMTVEPKAARDMMMLDSTPEFPKKEKDTRRKSVGTALCGLRPATLLPPSPALHSTTGLNEFVIATSTTSSNRRLSTDSATSSSSTASRLSLSSTDSSPAAKANPTLPPNTPHSSELDLLRQALRAKGTQNKNLKEKLEALNTLVEGMKSAQKTLEAERDDIGSECEELIKQNEELQAGKAQDAETKVAEGEKVKEMEEKVKMADAEIETIKKEASAASEEAAAVSKELKDTQFKLSAAQDDNEDLMEELKEKTAGLEEQVEKLKKENEELKKEDGEVASLQELLQNSNEAIEEARQTAVDLEAEYANSKSELQGEIETLKQDLEDALAMAEEAQENAAQANVNEELAAKMKEMEEMHKLEIDELKEELSSSKRSVAIEFEQATSKIKGELKNVEDDLAAKETEAYELKQKVEDLQEQQTAAEGQIYEKQQQVEDLQEQVESTELGATAARNAADQANVKIFELAQNVKKLEADLKSAKEESSDNGAEEVEKFKAELAAKDARIKKLEAVRLTKEQCAALKKMKEERISYMKKAKELEKVNERLRTSSSDGSVSDEAHKANLAEISKLKESNDAIGNKLRKYAEHCQKLEAEKAAIIDTIQKTDGENDAESDFAGAVAALCERLSAAEEECEALASSETRANTYLTQLDRAKEEKAKLVENNKIQSERVAKLQSVEASLSESLNKAETKVTELEAQAEELKSKTTNMEGEKGEVEAEKTKQVRFLEQENLNLMMETKTLKRNLQTVQAELAAYRAANSVSSSPALKEIDGNAGTPGTGKKKTPQAKSSTKKRVTRKRAAMMKAAVAGLGEAGDLENEDNTEECKQS